MKKLNFGLIGRGLKHTFSPQYFNDKFNTLGLPHQYKVYELEHLACLSDWIQIEELHGFNVTIPYKEAVITQIHTLEEAAKITRAVNCVKILRNGGKISLIGHNTDVFGFQLAIKPHLRHWHTDALILGDGATSRSVCHVLSAMGIQVRVVARKTKPGVDFTYDQLNDYIMTHHKLVVNTTPVGMYPQVDACLPVPMGSVNTNHLLLDVIYNPLETLLMKAFRARGAQAENGLNMLHAQAEASWQIWNA